MLCAETVEALDRDADRHGYDAHRVVRLGLRPTQNAGGLTRYEVVAFDDQDGEIGRFGVSGVALRDDKVPSPFSVKVLDFAAGIDVGAVREYDWSNGDLEYREQLVVAALGEEYHVGVSLHW